MGGPENAVQSVKLIFATHNPHKLKEMQLAIGSEMEIISLEEAGIRQEIPEPFDTLKENALVKAETIHRISGGENCFSEDTGLEVDALGGQPGVHSARYAGEPVSPANNIQKLLRALGDSQERQARFITVICLILRGKTYFFEGRCEGQILRNTNGVLGFGYDPVFLPEGATKSFAQMDPDEKNTYSHRRKAADELIRFLKKQTELPVNGQN